MNNSFKGKRSKSVVFQLEDPGWMIPKLIKRLPPIPQPGDPRRYLSARVCCSIWGIGDRRRNSCDQIVGGDHYPLIAAKIDTRARA